MKSILHEQDFLLWTEQQASLLRTGKFSELDDDGILEEIEDMEKEQKVVLQSLLRQTLVRLLKIGLSPTVDPRAAWIDKISEFRAQAEVRLAETPSLRHDADGLFQKAWPQARKIAEKSFAAHGEKVAVPTLCPYTLKQVLDTEFLPRQ